MPSGERRIRTSEVVRQQIYSLPQLAALVSPHWCNPARIAEAFPRKLLYVNIFNERASDRIRTDDRRFTKPLLYQLSYTGFFRKT